MFDLCTLTMTFNKNIFRKCFTIELNSYVSTHILHCMDLYINVNNGGYMTTNNSTSNITGDTDNSVTFESGAIQITANNSSAEEAERLAKKIMELIKRQKQLDGMMSYA